jgi:hypothetical protein
MKIKRKTDFYCTDEYREIFPYLERLYKNEGLDINRKQYLKRKRDLKKKIQEDGFYSLFY